MEKANSRVSSSEKETALIVNDLKIRKNALYIIEHKLDKSAPDGFQKEGATKLPSEGIGNTISCRFVDKGNGQGKYDTGFYKESPCYEGLDDKTKKEQLNAVLRMIVSPYESLNGEGVLDVKNHEFWDNYTVDLYEGRVFNTEKIEDLLDLYIAVRSFDLTPTGQEGSPKYSDSDYMIKDANESMSVSKRRNSTRMSVIANFMTLLNANPEKLRNILKYLSVTRTGEKLEGVDLQNIFSVWLDKDIQNADLFDIIFDKCQTKEGEDEITLYVKVKTMVDNKKISREGGDLIYNGEILGADVKSVVNNLMNNSELSEILHSIRIS